MFVRDVIEASLTENAGLELIDRSQLTTTLSETVKSEIQSPTTVSRLKVTGANFGVYPKISSFGGNVTFSFRVVDLATSTYRTTMVETTHAGDPMVVAVQATEKIVQALGALSETKLQKQASEVEEEWPLAKDKPRFKIALRIPESSTRQLNPDPAGEKELSSVLLANDFSIIQLSRPSQSVAAALLTRFISKGRHMTLFSRSVAQRASK